MWQKFAKAFETFFSGERAVSQAAETNRIERYFTFANFARSAERCAEQMESYGLEAVELESFPADGKTKWSGWPSMKAWDVESAQLHLSAPRQELLCDWTLVPQSLVMYSGLASLEAEVIEWDGEQRDLHGRIPLTRRRINDVFPAMRAGNIRGVLSDFIGTLPGVRDPFDIPDSCRWENSAIRRGHGQYWGFMLTPRQGRMIRDLLRSGPVRVRAEVKAHCYEGSFKSATGLIRGTSRPDEEILFLTHLYEPGANDNASGVGCGLEIARALQAAIRAGAIPPPARTIRFLFGWEGNGTMAWMEKHRADLGEMLGGINIDEIGVDQSEGRSVVHLFMPPAANPSCVGPLLEHLCGQILAPQIRFRAVADRAEIINDTVPSDPNINVPVPCLIQYPSKHYHASSDRMATLSAAVMKKIGLVTATQLYVLASAGEREARWIGEVTRGYGERKLLETDLKFLTNQWPFSIDRTVRYFLEQFHMAVSSVGRFGLSEADSGRILVEVVDSLARHQAKWSDLYPERLSEKREQNAELREAAAMVPARSTLGAPMAWGSMELSPDEEATYRKLLYDNKLDLLFHRICYWSNGSRSLLDILDRLEIELHALSSESHISRTSSDLAIPGTESPSLNLGAVLFIVRKLIRSGYLKTV